MLTLRLRGIYAAVMAWFVGIALLGLANNLTTLTRGSMGLHPPTLFATTNNLPYFYVILAMLLLIYITLRLVTKSSYGLAFKAIGQNIDAARASGYRPDQVPCLQLYALVHVRRSVGRLLRALLRLPDAAECDEHVEDRRGARHRLHRRPRQLCGAASAIAFPFIFLIEYLRSSLTDLPGLQLVIYGVLMIVVMIYYPAGLAGHLLLG